jgi:hypothetical protein
MRKNERTIVSRGAVKAPVRTPYQLVKAPLVKTAVRGTIVAKQVKSAKPVKAAQKFEVAHCGPCGDSSSSSSDQQTDNNECQPISFTDCDCTDIELDCVDSTSNIDPQTGLNRELQDALGLPVDIIGSSGVNGCASSNCVDANGQTIPLTLNNVTVVDVPDLSQNPTRNGPFSQRVRIFTVTDACGQSATLVRTVTFRETGILHDAQGHEIVPGPVATCPTDRTVPCGTPQNQIRFDAPSFTDACGSCNIDVTPRLDRPFFNEAVGDVRHELPNGDITFTRTWTATGACDLTASCTQTITETCSLGPTGCDAVFWSSPAGLEFWNDENDRLVQQLATLGHEFTTATPSNEIFGVDFFSHFTAAQLIDPNLRSQILAEIGDCANLVGEGIVALLNIAAIQAFPNVFPNQYQFPAGTASFQELYDLIVATINEELSNTTNDNLCSLLATELADANSAVCKPATIKGLRGKTLQPKLLRRGVQPVRPAVKPTVVVRRVTPQKVAVKANLTQKQAVRRPVRTAQAPQRYYAPK